MAFPTGTTILPLDEVRGKAQDFLGQLEALQSQVATFLSKGPRETSFLTNEMLLNQISGRASGEEAARFKEVKGMEKRQGTLETQIEKWIQVAFDPSTAGMLLNEISVRASALGGGANSHARILERRIERMTKFLEDLITYLDVYKYRALDKEPMPSMHSGDENENTILIFVALSEEFDFLKQRWGLTQKMGAETATGKYRDVIIHLLTPRKAGRVPAAVTVTALVARGSEYKLVIVIGIAGGFKEEKVNVGDVIVADKVVDLASRKIRQSENEMKTEFRPDTYEINDVVKIFCESDLFDKHQWAHERVKSPHWPDKGRHPQIQYGPIASIDEVVSDDDWRTKLLQASPKLLGVEMEAGGVCDALRRLKRAQPCVIRGVSDSADPMKIDGPWRIAAMESVCLIVEQFLTNWDTVRKHL
jgi:nucleoside phosphorylase